MSFFSDRMGQFVDRLTDAAGETVSLSRASITPTEITAIAADSDDGASGDNATSNYWEREWMIKKAAYEIDGAVATPQTADRITDSDGDVWEVMFNGQRQELVQHAAGYAWLVRTKRIVVG